SVLSREEAGVEGPARDSDFYRLGLLAYEMLAGKPPFVAGSIADLISLHIDEAPLPIDLATPDARASDDIERIIMRALAKLPRFRHASPEEFSRDLEEAVDHSRKTSVLQNMSFPPECAAAPLVAATDGLPQADVLTGKSPVQGDGSFFLLETQGASQTPQVATSDQDRAPASTSQAEQVVFTLDNEPAPSARPLFLER